MRKQIYQNQISAEYCPQVTRFAVLPERGEERQRGGAGGLTGIDEGGGGWGLVEGDLDCLQDYQATADCEANKKQRRHLNKLCACEAERSE